MSLVLTTLSVSPGSGVQVAMYQISETNTGDSTPTTKLLQRVVLNDSEGNDATSGNGLNLSGIYENAPTPVGSGSFKRVHIDENGYLIVVNNDAPPGGDLDYHVQGTITKVTPINTYSPVTFQSRNAIKWSIRTERCNIMSLQFVSFETTTLYWLQMFDSVSEPTTGTACKWEVPVTVAADATHPVIINRGKNEWGDNGMYMTNGAYIGLSSTPGTYTSASAATTSNYNIHVERY